MNVVTRAMFMLLRSQICGTAVDIDIARSVATNHDDFAKLYSLSKNHDVAHIVGAALDSCELLGGESEIAAKFKKQYFTAVYRYKRIEYELSELLRVLNDAKIDHIPLKGSVIRKHYPAPWMRTSCDIDILVRESDLESAADLLVNELKYKREETTSHDISFFSESGVHVELHYDLIEESVNPQARRVLESVWEHTTVTGGEYTLELSDAMFCFYHAAHAAKHFVQGGCGIKPFIDQWILEYRVEHDTTARTELLSSGGLLAFYESSQELCDVWLSGKEHSEKTEIMQFMILSGGTYGVMENMVSVQQIKRGGKLKYALSRIFLPYETLKFQFPVIQKHKWLTPLFEVIRWFKLLFCGGVRRSARELKRNSTVSDEESRKVQKLLDQLGL